MKYILLFVLLALVSCGNRGVSTIELGGGYSIRDVGDYQSFGVDGLVIFRGKIQVILNNDELIFGYLNPDVDELDGLSLPQDNRGYFIINKKDRRFLGVNNIGKFYFDQ